MIRRSEKIKNEYQDELLEVIEKLSECAKTLKWSLMRKVPGDNYDCDHGGWIGDPIEIKDTIKDFKPDMWYGAWVQINNWMCTTKDRSLNKKEAETIIQEHKNKTIPAEYHDQLVDTIKDQKWPFRYDIISYKYTPKHSKRKFFGNPEVPIAVIGRPPSLILNLPEEAQND